LISILIVSHGELAAGMLNALQMLTGKQEKIAALGLIESEAPEDLVERIREKVDNMDDGDGVLITVDLFGASPFQSSSRLFLESDRKIEVITGVNLPMLAEIMVNREDQSLEDLLKQAYQAGQEGIQMLPDRIRNAKSSIQ
jgi:PTS system mannose-specific IIA component